MDLPTIDQADSVIGLTRTAFARTGGLDELQESLVDDLGFLIAGETFTGGSVLDSKAITQTTLDERERAMRLCVVLEMMEHPLDPEVAVSVQEFFAGLGIEDRLLEDARFLADRHFETLAADLDRHGWYREQTIEGRHHGKLIELLRSRLAERGVVADPALARRWRALGECPDGSWGRGVYDFYLQHGFPFPGERHGIYELGARHDWVHVLTDYGTDGEGELDVFAFIAATMPGEAGLSLLAVTLGIFQNDALKKVRGKVIRNAKADTIDSDAAVDRWAVAFWRGRQCNTDIMADVDLFAMAETPVDDARRIFNIVPTEDLPQFGG